MKMQWHHSIILAATVLAACAALGSPAIAEGMLPQPASWKPPALRLAGVWNVNVTLRNCMTGAAVKPAFAAMNQFGADGSEFEVGVNTSPSRRYPSFGTWWYLGKHKYRSEFSFFLFKPDGSFAGVQDVTRIITLSQGANAFSSIADVSIYGPQHNLLKTGCATETATRF